MATMNLVDTNGGRHAIDPLSVTAIREDDAGCVLIRERNDLPILLHETVEVMCDALISHGIDRARVAAVNSAGQQRP